MINLPPSIEAILQAALSKPTPEGRAEYLDQACGGNTDLRRHVERLLAAPHPLEVESPATAEQVEPVYLELSTRSEPTPTFTASAGAVIGPYKLLQKLGEGGMGAVFVAEQEQPVRRRVALKVIKPGMDSAQVIARFEAERQALALMDHANIAKVLDAGTTSGGRPFFVMELVKGMPINKYCDEHHLSVRKRLKLFISVCQAIQHAHTKGIIHRDIKPSNVLVAMQDGKPVPKVIDFGVAKALHQRLTEHTLMTDIGAVVGTLEYMAPEQAELTALDIDTRADIYSLGVLLYLLLTGSTPFSGKRLRGAAYTEALRIIKEEEPPRPSTRLSTSEELPALAARRQTEPHKLGAELKGELDWIVMKALEKDRTRRYETASGFARDLDRYLRDEPVEACPPSPWYRLRKWIKRRPAIAALLVSAFLAPLAIAGLLWWHAADVEAANTQIRFASGQLRRERDAAETARAEEKKQRDLAEQREKTTQRHLYAARLGIFPRLWETGRISSVDALLEATSPDQTGGQDLRGWEWYHIHRLSHSELVRFTGHHGSVQAAVFSPDGTQVASAADDGILIVWDAKSGRELQRLRLSEAAVLSLAFSPDGQHLAAGCSDGTAAIVDAATGQPTQRLHGHVLAIHSVTYSRDGKTLATAGADNVIKLWDSTTGKVKATLVGHRGEVRRLWFHQNGQRLASAGDDAFLRFWSLPDGKEDETAATRILTTKCALSPELGRLVSWFPFKDKNKLALSLLPDDLKVIDFPDYLRPVRDVSFSADGRLVGVASDAGDIQVWEPGRGAVFSGRGGAHTVVFSQAGDRIASICDDNSVRIWPARSVRAGAFRGHDGWVRRLAFHPQGKRLASGDATGSIRLWNVASGKTVRTLGIHIAERGPPGKPAPAALLDMKGKKPLRHAIHFKPPSGGAWGPNMVRVVWVFEGHSGDITGLDFSRDGRLLASAGERDVRLWDVDTGNELKVMKHPERVSSLALSPDGSLLATGCWDDVVRVWNVTDGTEKLALRGHEDNVEAVVFHADGHRLASAGVDKTVRICDLTTGKTIRELRGHTATIHALALSPDGRWLASGSSDQIIRVWDFESGELMTQLAGHTGRVSGLLFLPGQDRLVSTSNDPADGTARLWDWKIGREVVAFAPPLDLIHGVAFDPTHQALAVTAVRQIELWEASKPQEVMAAPQRPVVAAPASAPLFPVESEARVLGFQRLKSLPKMHDRKATLTPSQPGRDFFVAVVSAPHAGLYPTGKQHQALREKHLKDPDETPVGPVKSYALYDPGRFSLILPGGTRLPATAIGPLPSAFDRTRGGGFHPGIIVEASTSTFAAQERALFAVAWEVDPADSAALLRLQWDQRDPAPIPNLLLDGYRGNHRSGSGIRRMGSSHGSDLLLEQRTYSTY